MNFLEYLILENEVVRLEPLDGQHLLPLLSVLQETPELLFYSPNLFSDRASLETYIDTALKVRAEKIAYAFAIWDKRQNAFAGTTRFANYSQNDLRVEIGWTWIGKKFHRTGLNRNCKFLLLQYAFEQLNLERVELKADARNENSRKAMEAMGATYEGMLRSHMLMSDGHRRDTVYYSILKNEWKDIKSTCFTEKGIHE